MMSSTSLAALVAHCRKLTRRRHAPDAELLRRFAGQREAAAFEELVERYAPMVWGVCRRILHREADCEDAFQATFLSLVGQVGSIDPNRPLGAWLHTIAFRTAAKARTRLGRQPLQMAIPEQASHGDIADELGDRELFRLVDEEIARLPALLREPFVLCCLEGRTRDEAAAALGCSVAAIKSRLERSRNLLRRRLEKRGFGLPAAFLVLGLTGGHVRAALRAKALHCLFDSTPATVAALVPAAGVSLASKLTLTVVSVAMVGVLGFGAFHVMQAVPPQEIPTPAKKSPPSPAAEKPQPRLDRFGDPLPPGAVRRFGTLRLRHNYPILYLAFTPDSKQLMGGVNAHPLAVFDLTSGRKLRTIGGSSGGNHYGFALSPDGKRVVSGSFGTLFDYQSGKQLRQFTDGPAGQWSSVVFSPDGKIVAAAREFQAEIVLVDANTGKQLVQRTFKAGRFWPPQYSLSWLQFSPDGKYLAVRFTEFDAKKEGAAVLGVMERSSQIWLLDAAKGDLMRTIGSSKDAIHSFAFQPGTGHLATAGKDGTIRFWDVNTGKEVHHISAATKEKSWGILRFLEGGKKCALASFDSKSESAFLTIVDVKDGKELRRVKLNECRGHIVMSPDGRTIASPGYFSESCVRIWDAETGVERFADTAHRTAAMLSLTTDGRTLISRGGKGRVIHWDLRTGNGQVQPAHAKKGDDKPAESAEEWSLRGPRWRLVLHHKTSEMEVKSCDGTKLLRKVKWPSSNMWEALLSPEGTHLAVPVHDHKNNAVLLWDPERENEPHKLTGPPSSPPLGFHFQHLLFSHDGKRLLIGCGTHNPSPPNTLWEWDVATAKIIRKLPIKFSADHLILSSDDRVLLTASRWEDPVVHVWDMETGRQMTTLTDPLLPPMKPDKYEMDRYIASLHLSADERFLVAATHRGDSSGISVWDTASWKTVRSFPWTRQQNNPHSMILSREGLSLFVANSDTTILQWDVSGRLASGRRKPAGADPTSRLTPAVRLNDLWRTLRETPDKAYPAVWKMLDNPAESVPFLIGKLSPVQPVEEKRVRQLISQLDSETFAEREEANRQLLSLGEQTLPLLRQALKGDLSLEVKKRVEGVIESLNRIPPPDQLRLLRALAVLEWSNRPEAIEHLRRLAGAAPSALLTRAAKAAGQRRR